MDVNKLFALKQPCDQCPFRKEGGVFVAKDRMDEIIDSIKNDAPFHCHKTIDYDEPEKVNQVDEALYCAGALIYMQKIDYNNLPMRLGMAYGLFDPAALRGHEEVIDPEEVKDEAHGKN
jgi:hypothetical protein